MEIGEIARVAKRSDRGQVDLQFLCFRLIYHFLIGGDKPLGHLLAVALGLAYIVHALEDDYFPQACLPQHVAVKTFHGLVAIAARHHHFVAATTQVEHALVGHFVFHLQILAEHVWPAVMPVGGGIGPVGDGIAYDGDT